MVLQAHEEPDVYSRVCSIWEGGGMPLSCTDLWMRGCATYAALCPPRRPAHPDPTDTTNGDSPDAALDDDGSLTETDTSVQRQQRRVTIVEVQAEPESGGQSQTHPAIAVGDVHDAVPLAPRAASLADPGVIQEKLERLRQQYPVAHTRQVNCLLVGRAGMALCTSTGGIRTAFLLIPMGPVPVGLAPADPPDNLWF